MKSFKLISLAIAMSCSVMSFAQEVNNIDTASIKKPAISFNTRCMVSLNKNDEPLYLIDGEIVNADKFRTINPETIESVTILKDSVAKNHFSGQTRNGVIVIKTKKNSPKEISKK